MSKLKILAILLSVFVVFSGCLDKKAEPSEDITRGLDLMVRGDYDKAVKIFSEILLKDQNNSLALYYRGLSYYKNRDDAAGTKDFEKLYSVDKDFNYESGYLWNVITVCFNVRKDYPKTIEISQFYIKKYPDDVNVKLAYNLIAHSYLRLKDFEKAIDGYKKVIEIAEKGQAIRDKQITAEAKGAIGFIKENSDFDRKPLTMFADIQNEIDPFKKIEIARKLLELYPKSTLADDVQYQIARLYSVDGLNDFDQATKEYNIFLKKFPNSPLVKQVENSLLGISEKYDPNTRKLKGSIHN